MNIIKRIRNKIKRKIYSYQLKSFVKNKDKLDLEIKNSKIIGVQNTNKTPRIIISLTSFPQRMHDIHFSLYSLLTQSIKPNMVVLWLGEDKFLNKEKDLPESVLNLCKNGLTIKWCKDIRSYTKLIPSLKEYPNDIIVTADDDIYYQRNWLKKLVDNFKKYPEYISAHRTHRVLFDENNELLSYNKWKNSSLHKDLSYLNFLTGVGGVLYPPHCLDEEVFNEDAFKKLAPYADDVWFWAMAIKKGTKTKNTGANFNLIYVNPEREFQQNDETTLYSTNREEGAGNDKQIKAVLDTYNLHEKLKTK